MSSEFKGLLIPLQNRLVTEIPNSPATPGIAQADQDLGQIDIEGQRPAVAFPWAGIDFFDTSYTQMQTRQQRAKIRLSIRLAFPALSSGYSQAPTAIQELANQYYDIEDKIYKVLQGWQVELPGGGVLLITGLRRLSAVSEKRGDLLRVRRIVFECECIVNSLWE